MASAHHHALNPVIYGGRRPACHGRLHCDLQALGFHEFRIGLALGGVALLIVTGVALASRRRPDADARGRMAPLPLAGATAIAFVGALRASGHWIPGVAVGLLALAVAGLVADALTARLALRMLLAIPGAWILAVDAWLADPAWVKVFVVAVVVGAGCAVADLDRRTADAGLAPLLVAITVVGVYETVPDILVALVLLGCALPLVLVGWPRPLASFGGAGSMAIVGAIMWVVAADGIGRLSAVIGGGGCLAILVVEPAARALSRSRAGALDGLQARAGHILPIALLHLAMVYTASRVAGLRRSVGGAVLILVPELVVATSLAWWATRQARTPEPPPPRSVAGGPDRRPA